MSQPIIRHARETLSTQTSTTATPKAEDNKSSHTDVDRAHTVSISLSQFESRKLRKTSLWQRNKVWAFCIAIRITSKGESIMVWKLSDRGMTKWKYELTTLGLDGVDGSESNPFGPRNTNNKDGAANNERPSRALTDSERARWSNGAYRKLI